MTEKTVKCPICEQPYVVYPYYAGDQSACPACRKKAREDRSEWELIRFYYDPPGKEVEWML
jgi:hypothetical protein